jgi:CSLREA domain-containing protein
MYAPNRLRSRLRLEPLEERAVPAIINVTTLADETDPNDGLLSLREAIDMANTNGEADTINLAPGGTYALTSTLSLASGVETTINGNGATLTRSMGAGTFRIIDVGQFAILSIDRVTITKGVVFEGSGGGILVEARGRVTVTNTTISDNLARRLPGIAAGDGGGIAVLDGAAITIVNSTISGNSAEGSGGGIFSSKSSVTVANSTFSGNSAKGFGGGLFVDGTATIRNSTIAFNSADSDNAGGGEGGGIFVFSGGQSTPPGTVTLQSTIVGDNAIGITGSFADIAGAVTAGSCLIGDVFGTTLANGSVANITGQDPQMEALADNGGSTQTHALRAGSPAIGKGSNPLGLEFDQRGQGFKRVLGAGIDIGAFEATPPEAPPPPPAGSVGFGAATFSGSEGGGPVTITLVRSGGSAGSLTVDLNAAGGSGDFSGVPTTVTFADGQTTASVPLPIVDDALVEGPESFSLSLNGASVGTPATATLQITDNDAAPPPPPPPPLQTPRAPASRIFHYLPFIQSPHGLKFAVADVTNDGVADLLIARKGRGPAVVADGATGQMTFAFIIGYHPGFGNGVLLGGLDSDGDGLPNFFVGLTGVRL